MATTFNTGPYFDDFDPTDNFYRVLFKPGYAVQARELNQLQSILQHQVSRTANHLFKKNAIVIPGGIAINNAASIVSVTEIADPSVLVGKTITNATSFDPTDDSTLNGFITAVVLGYKAAGDNYPAALYVKYFKTQTDGRSTFNQSETLSTVDSSLIVFSVDSTVGSTIGKVATISAGTFYTKELFVDAATQSVIVEVNRETTTNCNIGLNIIESIVTSDEDTSLLDNANGSPNQYAPGADRFKVELVLDRIDASTAINDDNFIKMMTIENNVVTFINNKTQYAELMTMLARRTYDANGNFIVRGLDTSVTPSSDTGFVIANVTGGKCYLGGYEYEQIATTPIALEKPRSATYQQQVDPVTRYASGMTYFYVAGGIYAKEIPVEDSLVQFLNVNPVRQVFDATSGSIVNLTDNTITITDHSFVTGNAVTYSNGGGTSIGGLTSGVTYYVIRISSSVFKLATTPANSESGTAIDLTSGAVGSSHVIEKQASVIGYGIFKDIQYVFGTTGSSDVYKVFFDFVSLETGYVLSDIGGVKAIVSNQGVPVLHELRLSNTIGTFTAGNTIASATDAAQTALMYNVVNNLAYVIKNKTTDVPFTDTLTDTTTNATAVRASSFVTNYTSASFPVMEIDASPIKTLYNLAGVNTTAYSVVRKDQFNVVGAGTLTVTLAGDDLFEDISTSDYFAYNTTTEQFIDLTGLLTLTNAGRTYNLTIAGGSPLIGSVIWVYSTVNKLNVNEAKKTLTTATAGIVIPTPSNSWMPLAHQDVIRIKKIVEGQSIAINAATWTSNVATFTSASVHGLTTGDVVVITNVFSSSNTSGAFNAGYNRKFTVASTPSTTQFTVSLTVSPGTSTTLTDASVALPPNINTDTDVTSRYVLDTGNTAYLSSTGMIKLNKNTTAPQGQIAVQYNYYSINTAPNTGNYISVDSYGTYTDADLFYIGNIADLPTPQGGKIEARRYLDFRTRPSNYFFKNIGTIASGSSTLVLRDLNLSYYETSLVNKYVVGPSHLNGATISAVTFNKVTGNTELTLSSAAAASDSGTYYIGLNTSGLSLVDSTAGAKSFEYPKDSTRMTYQYVKFLPRSVLVFIDRNTDVLKVDFMDVRSRLDAVKLQRNEYKLPLAFIYMQPYSVSLQDISLEKFENPVYQMLDIHNLKKRIDRNEYYAALALGRDIHQEILDAQNEDLSQASRGIWAEDFMDISDQDYYSDDFACTIYDRSYVAPGTVTRTVALELDTALNTTTWSRTGSAITLPYTETRAFGSTGASRSNNLNPFNVINWTGKLVLNPSVDNWVDTTSQPQQTVNNTVVSSNAQNTSTSSAQAQSTATATVGASSQTTSNSITSTAQPSTTQLNIPISVVVSQPPVVVPAPPVDEIVIEINNLRTSWGPDSAGGRHSITFDWVTNLGRRGRVNTDIHLSTVLNSIGSIRTGHDGTYARSLINRRYNDAGVKEYLNAGAHFDQRPPNQW